MYNQAAQDPSRISRDGCCTVSLEIEYPVTLAQHGGFGRWDDRELIDRVHAAHLDLLDGLAPGFRAQVVDSLYYTPLDNWRRNASAVYGHELGGDASGAQWYTGRMPVRGLPGLYFSNGIWPASLTHLGPGYIAACEIAEDLGVRRQPWWRYRPLEYALERATGT
jgi:phytoene dehydrogenase-like protein